MPTISTEMVAKAVHTITGYDLVQKETLCDKIRISQPHIFFTTLALTQDRVSMSKMDHLLHVLMIVHMVTETEASLPLPTISREAIHIAHKKHNNMLRYLEAESDRQMWDLTCTTYPEPVLLAYILNYLVEKGINTKTQEDYLILNMSKVILDVYVNAFKESN